tara:strand:+ start:1198 stop:1383 length:186 start_codon:yes stop_codon:yes gene_type:complete
MVLVLSVMELPKRNPITDRNKINFFTITSSLWNRKNANLIAKIIMKQEKKTNMFRAIIDCH